MNLNHARLPIPPFPQIAFHRGSVKGLLVGRGGFEPPKSATADLQSAPFGHSGTYPCLKYNLSEPEKEGGAGEGT